MLTTIFFFVALGAIWAQLFLMTLALRAIAGELERIRNAPAIHVAMPDHFRQERWRGQS